MVFMQQNSSSVQFSVSLVQTDCQLDTTFMLFVSLHAWFFNPLTGDSLLPALNAHCLAACRLKEGSNLNLLLVGLHFVLSFVGIREVQRGFSFAQEFRYI